MLQPWSMHKVVAALLVPLCSIARPDEAPTQPSIRITPRTQIWEIGLEITGGDGFASRVVATMPVPDTWPEQQVKIIKQDKTQNVRQLSFKSLAGVRQMTLSIPRLAPGATAKAIVTFEVTRSFTDVPTEPRGLKLASPPSQSLRNYLTPSPLIESTDDKIRNLAEEITAEKTSAWEQAEAIYQWVRENVEYLQGRRGEIGAPDSPYQWVPESAFYRVGDHKGALGALRDRNGDCEEFASLIIALCRAIKIPARTVWVPGHCYCEFYLQDANGKGLWVSCDATRNHSFGSVKDPRVILQKGDNFYSAAERKRMRYARPTLSAADVRGRVAPTLKPSIRKLEPSETEAVVD